MSTLPERPSLEYLRKLAKDRLPDLRSRDPRAKLADALLAVARDHGFSSWRALKAEVDRRLGGALTAFFAACASGDVAAIRAALAADPGLARAENPSAPHGGWTALHEAAKRGSVEAARLLLSHGADPNAREEGDNTYPLHWAAATGHVEIARALLDAGGDVHGLGDLHALDTIGWAAVFGKEPERAAMAAFLVERGARHHVFSALALGDAALLRSVVERDPAALDRRLSRFEHGLSPVHAAVEQKRFDLLDVLIELGADLEAVNATGRTALEAALMQGQRETADRLRAAGAKVPEALPVSKDDLIDASRTVGKGVPMIYVTDVGRSLDWYVSIGFREHARYGDGGIVNFGYVSFGKAELMLNMNGKRGKHDVSLWFYTSEVDRLYGLLKARQLAKGDVEFDEDIADQFYGARQFAVRDPDGYLLYFIQLKE